MPINVLLKPNDDRLGFVDDHNNLVYPAVDAFDNPIPVRSAAQVLWVSVLFNEPRFICLPANVDLNEVVFALDVPQSERVEVIDFTASDGGFTAVKPPYSIDDNGVVTFANALDTRPVAVPIAPFGISEDEPPLVDTMLNDDAPPAEPEAPEPPKPSSKKRR